MKTLTCPKLWSDGEWLKSRHQFVARLCSDEPCEVSLVGCSWIDLQPLLDLLVCVVSRAASGVPVVIELDPDSSDPGELRTLRFLLDTGFVEALSQSRFDISIRTKEGDSTPEECLKTWRSSALPPRLLDYETIIPCIALDVRTFENRAAVFEYCKDLKDEYLTDRARAFRMPPQLIYEAQIFFDAVLPELLDNTRIHKPETPWCCFYARYRRREEISLSPKSPKDHDFRSIAPLDHRTRDLWNSDMVEACFVDTGLGIQESWINCWNRRSVGRKRVPTLKNGTRVDGENGALHILQGVFTDNESSLTAKERQGFDLPSNLTGLHSIKQSIQDSDWTFSVRSGGNYVIVSSQSSDVEGDDEAPPVKVKAAGRVSVSSGVQFLFRFTAPQGRILAGWRSAVPPEGVSADPAWWSASYPARFSNAHVVDNWEIPSGVSSGDVVLLRPAHVVGKGRVLELLREAMAKKINLVFCEIPEPAALRIYLLLDSLIAYDGVKLVCPVVTNTQSVNVPGPNGEALANSFVRGSKWRSAWWGRITTPVRMPSEVFCRCRQHDSAQFWSLIENDKSAFLREPVKWSDGATLRAGYLSYLAALRHRPIRKLLRKRLFAVIHAARVGFLFPSVNHMRHLTSELNRISGFENDDSLKAGLLASVFATGATTNTLPRNGKGASTLVIPAFRYPADAIARASDEGRAPVRPQIRALDWTSLRIPSSVEARFSRIGRTGRVRQATDGLVRIEALQQPSVAYRVWQQHGMLRIGHFSHTRHHLFVWLDLAAFLNGKTPDSNDMVARLAHEISELAPQALFYAPNDVSELLVDRLLDYVHHNRGLAGFPVERVWPITSVVDFSNLQTGNVSAWPADAAPHGTGGVAVFLDDVVLTGATARLAESHLFRLGYSMVHVVAILDRSESELEFVPMAGRFVRWWNLGVKSLGPAHACAICRGVESLVLLASQTPSETVREALVIWINTWTEKDSLRHDMTIEEVRLPKELQDPRRLGSLTPNIAIENSNGLAVWAFEIISRLRFYGYLFDKPRPKLSPVLMELLCGMVFMHWHDMSHDQQRSAVLALASQMWNEGQEVSRELIVIAFASLPRADAKMALEIMENQIGAAGVPHLDVALAYYALLHIAVPNTQERVSRIGELSSALRRQSPRQDTPADRGNALLTLLAGLERETQHYRLAIRLLGLPTGRKHHQYLHFALEEIRRAESPVAETASLVREIRALLEPIKAVSAERRAMSEKAGIWDSLQRSFLLFDVAISREDSSYCRKGAAYKALRTACAELYDVLVLGTQWRPSLRTLLSREYVHYVPFLVRSSIRQVIQQTDSERPLVSSDFAIDVPITPEEKLLLAVEDAPPNYTVMERLQNYDVVCCDKQYLVTALMDLLMDVRHAKDVGMPVGEGKAFMSISCAPKGQLYTVTLETRGTPEDAVAAQQGRTLRSIRFLLKEQQVQVDIAFDKRKRVVRKTLSLPLFRLREQGEPQ